ncbi:MAG: RNA methyltransferase [Lewinellaceae bacterium]|nr:RNA methyltransferase [Lewinellaceae bacterium]
MKTITSLQNPLVKKIDLLTTKSRERRREGLFVAEGLRETALALAAGYLPLQVFFDPAFTELEVVRQWCGNALAASPEVVALQSNVFEKLAYRSGVPNVLALFQMPQRTLEEVALPEVPLILVLESIEKPGNLGAILRTADAAGVDAVLVCDPATDLYNPNTIRASLGALFTLQVRTSTSEAAAAWLKDHRIPVYATYLEASRSLYSCDLTGPLALVMGAEASGISPFWIECAEERIIIPMQGRVDSMNVSASTAILLFEAVRQRITKARPGSG